MSIARWLDGKHAPGLRDCARALVLCTDDYRYRVELIVSSHKEAVAQLLDIAIGQDPSPVTPISSFRLHWL
ncbi:hypothetical protein LXA28_18295, partial [Erwinia amylovora]|uniref:hypothetical protein n=1 Tax=Erwinia amylovora TaxID=552 RepID=UPI0020C03B36